MRKVYTDNNATTRVAPEVVEEMTPFFEELYGNPSSMHDFGGNAAKAMAQARARLAALLGVQEDEIIYTSCGTESDNTAIHSALEAQPKRRHIVTTAVEHPAVRSLCKHLSDRAFWITELAVDKEGRLDLDELRDLLRDDTAIVSIMYANNETGVVFPIEEIGRIVKERGILFHTDAVQAVGKIPLDLRNSAIDMLSLSGHKLHAPKGIGALYVRRGVPFRPFLIGGHQEHTRRGGTENVPSIIGLGKAAELARTHIEEENTRVKTMRDRLEEGLLASCPGAAVNGDRSARLPNTTNISFEYVEGEAILLLMNEQGIAASSGSACTSGSLEPSHVLRAMGVPFTRAHGSVRFSLSRYNTEADVDYIIEKLPPIIRRLREISPYGHDAKTVGFSAKRE